MHCGSAGQAKYGGNPAADVLVPFKRAFEIAAARKIVALN
jgi:hypothetical protein